MTYLPGQLRARSKELIAARNWGVTGVTSLLGVTLFVSEVGRIRSLPPNLVNYLGLLCLGLTGVLIFLWIWSTQRELDMLFDWLDPERYVPPSTILETVLIISIGLFLSLMFLVSRDPLWFSVGFSLYALIQIWAGRYTYSEVAVAIAHSRRRLKTQGETGAASQGDQIYERGLAVLENYFVAKPLVARCFAILLGSAVSLSFAVAWKLVDRPSLANTSYVAAILTLVTSEIAIWRWRTERDSALREVTVDLAEFLRLHPHSNPET
ncbi:MAG TPA: hypothetical protein VI485_30320 [Vicinamibacterales bacterium]|nr:hypothetical protein [Vicinamibacterales bacterium]